ncbi:MAG: phosphatidylglycerophosphatase A [Pyrinomonadaceae bacterium]
MKHEIESRKPNGARDYIALAIATFGVGYIPGAPGTYGSIVGLLIYFPVHVGLTLERVSFSERPGSLPDSLLDAWFSTGVLVLLLILVMVGIWAAQRSIPLLGTDDPSQVVVDEVMGQIITFLFIPFTWSWPLIITGFLLFRIFDIWKPYPIDALQELHGGVGICADDILAGVYAGICLSIIYAISLSI